MKSPQLLRLLTRCTVCFCLGANGYGMDSQPRVSIDSTIYSGLYLDESNNSVVFRGLPYAKPPVGELRWKPPQSMHRATTSQTAGAVQQAVRFSPACPQNDGNAKWYRQVAAAFASADASTVKKEPISEDCLYLNIWSTNFNQEAKQPVMVWIHGGSNQTGWAFEPNYIGANLAQKEVVVVSINYRLGSFGFLAHPLLSAESELGISGNYGLLDQIAALRWIQNNISRFGGDPDRITLFGESAGAANITYLMLSPLTEGLFHRAISQSGGYLIKRNQTLKQEELMGVKLAQLLSLATDDKTLENMRNKTVSEILAATAELAKTHSFNVIIDGKILPDRPARMLARGEQNSVDLMIGTNANEWSMYLDEEITYAQFLEDLNDNFAEDAEQLKGLLHPNDAKAAMDQLYSSSEMLCPSQFIATSMSLINRNVYLYYFTRVRSGAGGEKLKAYHGAEIPYVFDNHDNWLPTEAIDRDLTEIMSGFWVEFAETRDPNDDDLPIWPPLGPAKNYLELGDRILIGKNLEKEICSIMDQRLHKNVISLP